MSDTRQIRLFISTDCEACEQVLEYVEAWVQQHPAVQLDVLPVLEHPVDVMQYLIFNTPALFVNGQRFVDAELSVEKIAEWLDNQFGY